MKCLVIGATGTIGQAIVKELQADTELLTSSLNHGDYRVDLSDHDSITKLFKNTGPLDAIICAASRGVAFKPLPEMTLADYLTSMQQKLLGQIAVVLEGIQVLNDKGSITLTTGIMNHDFVKNGSAAAMVNSAINAFAQAASLDMPKGTRINVVSPALLQESAEKYAALCPGFEPVSSEKVARAYRKSIYGIQTGQVYHVT